MPQAHPELVADKCSCSGSVKDSNLKRDLAVYFELSAQFDWVLPDDYRITIIETKTSDAVLCEGRGSCVVECYFTSGRLGSRSTYAVHQGWPPPIPECLELCARARPLSVHVEIKGPRMRDVHRSQVSCA